jgi:uncharacterized paraquat-inducible protein A
MNLFPLIVFSIIRHYETHGLVRLGVLLLAGIGIYIMNTLYYGNAFIKLTQFARRRKIREQKASHISNPNPDQIVCPHCKAFNWNNSETCAACGNPLRSKLT